MIIQGIAQGCLFIGEVGNDAEERREEAERAGYTTVYWPLLYGESVPQSGKAQLMLQPLSILEATPVWFVKIQSFREVKSPQVLEHYKTTIQRERARDAGLVGL